MVLELCGGTASDVLVAGEVPEPLVVIDFPVAEVKRLAGIDPSMSDVTDDPREARLRMPAASRRRATVLVTVPTWRPDVTMKADLVEEIVRIIGVDRVPVDAAAAFAGGRQAGADADPDAARAAPSGRSPPAASSRP